MRSRARFFVRGERIGRRLKEAGKQRTLDFGILIAGQTILERNRQGNLLSFDNHTALLLSRYWLYYLRGVKIKIYRLVGIITILLQTDKTTAPELAERFEVSRRTINRDMDDLCKAGIPIICTQGYGGGVYLAEGYKIDKSLFTKEQLQAVFTGLNGLDSVSKQSYSRQLIERLSRKNDKIIVDNVFVIDLASHYKISLTEKIDVLKQAIEKHCLISFEYYSARGKHENRIEPYRIVFKWSSWYVFGYNAADKRFKLYKLNRLWKLKTSQEYFTNREIPEGDLNYGEFLEAKNYRLKAEFEKSQTYRIVEEYGVDSFRESEQGNLIFEREFASYENMLNWALSFGDKITVLEPDILRADLYKQAKNNSLKYRV